MYLSSQIIFLQIIASTGKTVEIRPFTTIFEVFCFLARILCSCSKNIFSDQQFYDARQIQVISHLFALPLTQYATQPKYLNILKMAPILSKRKNRWMNNLCILQNGSIIAMIRVEHPKRYIEYQQIKKSSCPCCRSVWVNSRQKFGGDYYQ